jgi:hypothetical protein
MWWRVGVGCKIERRGAAGFDLAQTNAPAVIPPELR